jgi:REP element-mobilizing transposase RayT
MHHIYARGAARQDIFLDDSDRQRYLLLLARACRWTAWRCLTYCLMSNHMHLVIETPRPNLSHGMERFHGDYARMFNRRHGRSGHVFQGPFNAVSIKSDAQLWTTMRYIVNNPVEASLCTAPESYPWSSHAAIVEDRAPAWLDEARLFEFLGADGGDPRWRYAQLLKGPGPLG